MRTITCNLWQNTGSIGAGNQQVLSSNLVKIGTQEATVDDQLTKITPGEITVEVSDPTDTIWAFIQSQLTISSGLLPPFLQLLVGGTQVFLGIVDPSRIVRHLAVDAHSIEIGAQDWSVMLANSYLDSWSRPLPKAAAGRVATSALAGYSGPDEDLYRGYGQCDVIFAGAPNWVGIGDRLTCATTGATIYTALNVQSPPEPWAIMNLGDFPWPSGTLTQVTLDSSPWWPYRQNQVQNIYTDNFVRLASSTTDQDYFQVQLAVGSSNTPPVYTIQLDTVDGITEQDVLHCIQGIQGASWTVLSVNPELNQITTKEAVSNLNFGDRIYFDQATNAELVLVDAVSVIKNALAPFGWDTSRLVKGTLPLPVFGWIAAQSAVGSDNLMSVSDIEPNLANGLRVISGLTNAYHGTPDLGWTKETATTMASPQPQWADWTGQLTAAPSSLMPYELRASCPYARQRNRAYHDFNYPSVDNGQIPNAGLPSTWPGDGWTSAIGSAISAQVFYDYRAMRKITVAAGGHALTATPWTGSAWGSATGLTWPTGNALMSVCNFPTGPANALLAVTSANTLELALFTGSASCAVPGWLQGGILVPTPYGPYLIGAQGYAQVVYSGGTLSLNGIAFTDQVTCFWPQTFAARSSSEAVILGRLDPTTGASSQVTESWLFRLTLPPVTSTPNGSVIFSEKIAEGAPVFAGAVLDPTKAGRVVGHHGGRLWQVDVQVPWCVERFTPAGMTALDCIEHVCQLLNAMAVPLASGAMAIVSRGLTEAPIALTVSMVKNDQSLAWKNFYSIVRCTTQDGKFYYDAGYQPGGNVAQLGGTLLEISNQPMLWGLSQAGAMAESYSQWFGVARPTESHTWTYADPNTAPPWEGLPPFAKVTVNGTGPWRVMSTTQDYIEGTCQVVLVEA